MPLTIVTEDYNVQPYLRANVGDWVQASTNFSIRFQIGSGESNTMTYNTQGTNHTISTQQGDFGTDSGFVVGDTLTIIWTQLNFPPAFQSQSQVVTATYVSGNVLHLDTPLIANGIGGAVPVPDGTVFPSSGITSGMSIIADKAPDSIEFNFNLTPNGSSSLNSVIDSELNRFELTDIPLLPVSTPTAMIQLVNKSGGFITNVLLEYVQNAGDGWRDYRITYLFNQWGFIKDGYAEPNYYDQSDCLAPVINIKGYAIYNNPNGILQDTSLNTEASTGGYDENYNGGVNNYSVISGQWLDSLGNVIDALDNSGESEFEYVLNAPNQSNPNSTYRLGLIWRPEDGTFYQNNINDLASNLMLNAPIVDFIADGSTDPTVYPGFIREDGSAWDLTDIKFEITGVDELTISGKVIPNGFATALFANVPDGGRKTTLWVSIANHTLAPNLTDRVSLKLFDEDNIDAPTIGVQIPNVIDQTLLDHGGNDVTAFIVQGNTTTEDDVLYTSNFRLPEGIQYEGVRARFYAYNQVTDEEFTLEDNFFSFVNVPFINGKHEVYSSINRTFNLPPTTDRNIISLNRVPANDVPGQYALRFDYGYLSDWRYWQEQANVDNDFFNPNLSFDGKNKNWQRFFSGDWILRLSYYTRLNGVDDFNHQDIGIRPYEDEDATTDVTYTVISTGQTPNEPVSNEEHLVEAVITWNVGSFTNEWAEVTVEDFESGNRWVISSVLPQGNVVNNPLKPISGSAGLDVVISPSNVATLSFILDTNVISSNKISMSYRIYSEDTPIYEYLLTVIKDAELGFSLRKLSTNTIYPDSSPCIRVRRSSDGSEQDIGFNNNQLDTVALLNHVNELGAADGYVVTWYDQSGNLKHCTQSVLAFQPRIVNAGVVDTDPDNGLPALFFDGVDDHFNLQGPLLTSQLFFQLFVFNRDPLSTVSNSLGGSSSVPTAMLWFLDNSIYSYVSASIQLHASGQTQTGDFIMTSLRNALDEIKIDQNASSFPTQVAANSVQQFIYLGRRGGQYHNKHMQEVVYWAKDKESDKINIQTNANNFYNVYP